ncbi:hypothetical protein, partial [Nocardia mangyaensis]|uniref:hypothetical protein n=1 Tax=Nocardia mangyaensis TaxID=2213200 RepID=UPI00267721EF
QYGYILVSADVKSKTAEKRADYGIMKAFEEMNNSKLNCNDSKSYGNGVMVYTVKSGSNCFIKSVGSFFSANVSKIAVVSTQLSNSKYDAAVICNLTNLNVSDSGSIEICYDSCITPALITGNDYRDRLNNIQLNTTCSNNNKGITALSNPYKYDDSLGYNSELLSVYFKN